MATQGLVSVVRNGRVIAKVVAGCGGERAPALAETLDSEAEQVPRDLIAMAGLLGCGCTDCLVVMVAREGDGMIAASRPSGAEALSGLYASTFDDPRFNPRWTRGTAPYVEIVGHTHGTYE